MKIARYEDFQKLNEELSLDDILDKIKPIILKCYEMGKDYLIQYLEQIKPDLKKRLITSVALVSLLVGPCGMTPVQVKRVFKVPEIDKTLEQTKKLREKFGKEFLVFLDSIANRESSGDPESVNSLGYIGKYQFGKIALKDINKDIDTEEFKDNPEIWPEHKQDSAMVALLVKNKKYLGKYYQKYDGKVIGGIKITKSGMLAGSHLLGASNVKKFLETRGKHNPKDGYGTKLTEYLEKFGGYKIKL
ncbi:hypothetical protein EBU94_02105 [bacterium]|nr:hypothetical protein [bacterium]